MLCFHIYIYFFRSVSAFVSFRYVAFPFFNSIANSVSLKIAKSLLTGRPKKNYNNKKAKEKHEVSNRRVFAKVCNILAYFFPNPISMSLSLYLSLSFFKHCFLFLA